MSFATEQRDEAMGRTLTVVALLLAAVLVLAVGYVKKDSVRAAYRHTEHVAAAVVTVSADRVAQVRYTLQGRTRTGTVDLTAQQSVDRGDRLALRVSTDGRRLLLETPWLSTMYPATAAALALIGLVLLLWRRPDHQTQPRRHRFPPAAPWSVATSLRR